MSVPDHQIDPDPGPLWSECEWCGANVCRTHDYECDYCGPGAECGGCGRWLPQDQMVRIPVPAGVDGLTCKECREDPEGVNA